MTVYKARYILREKSVKDWTYLKEGKKGEALQPFQAIKPFESFDAIPPMYTNDYRQYDRLQVQYKNNTIIYLHKYKNDRFNIKEAEMVLKTIDPNITVNKANNLLAGKYVKDWKHLKEGKKGEALQLFQAISAQKPKD